MSRFFALRRRIVRNNAHQSIAITPWHIACISLLSEGCIFWLPLEEVQVNEGPTITSSLPGIIDADSSPLLGDTVVIDREQMQVLVIVEDPDDLELLSYRWTISSYGLMSSWKVESNVGTNAVGNQLTLTNTAGYNGRMLTFFVQDSFGESASIEWPIEVVGELR